MKRMKLVVFFLILISNMVTAQSVFDQGNDHYREGNYEAAIQSYESIIKDGKHSCDLYYNLANSYYKLEKVAPAIYYYEKALLISPNDMDIQNNLKFAQAKTIDEIKEVPKVGFEKLVQNFTGLFHYNSWSMLAIAFSVLFFLLFLGYYFSGTSLYKRMFFIGMFIIPLMIVLSVLAAWFEHHLFEQEQPAIVFAEVIEVKNEPRENATEAFTIHEGTKVFIIETLDHWHKIQLADESEGWILAETIKPLKP